MKNIVLVGFMGTGKTVVGKALAKNLGMKYVSTDDIIEERERRPINEIFAKSGEACFRKAEKAVVKELSGHEGYVIAAGGGVVLDEANIDNLKKNGIMICLSATPESILERTKNFTHRPLLNVPSPIDAIKRLLEERAPYYAKADYTVDTAGKKIKELVDEIKRLIRGKI